MKHDLQSATTASHFNLKRSDVELVPSNRSSRSVSLTLGELEAMRVNRLEISASKHGLETICGASCETGAQ
jgi:hypothetical protein